MQDFFHQQYHISNHLGLEGLGLSGKIWYGPFPSKLTASFAPENRPSNAPRPEMNHHLPAMDFWGWTVREDGELLFRCGVPVIEAVFGGMYSKEFKNQDWEYTFVVSLRQYTHSLVIDFPLFRFNRFLCEDVMQAQKHLISMLECVSKSQNVYWWYHYFGDSQIIFYSHPHFVWLNSIHVYMIRYTRTQHDPCFGLKLRDVWRGL